MAVSSSNRSPSPVSARPNSCSRTPEFNNPIRRSFSGSPFNKPSIVPNPPRSFNSTTPSNSPSDFGQRNSIDRSGGSFRDNEEKENEKEQSLKTGKLRSPAVSNGSKHFMSPTISAASKITAASPRKKVLTDRNEPLRTSSVSFSDGKSLPGSLNLSDVMDDSDSNPEIDSNQKKIDPSVDSKQTGLETPLIPKAPKVVKFSLPSNSNETESSTVTDIDLNRVNGDLNARFMISPTPSPSCSTRGILAPLDADPSVPPPYDPQTNYLSPRPQFLHYRPNPRVGVYLNKESFNFESLSDTETTEETESEESLKESEDDSSVEIVKEEERVQMVKEVEEKEPDVAESDPISTHSPTKTVEAKGVSKKHFWSRSKFISLFLILVVACLSISVTDTPFSDSTDKLGVLQFYNLSALQEDIFLDGYLMNDIGYEVGVTKYAQTELVPIREVEDEISALDEKGRTEIGADEDTVDVSLEEKGHTEIGADMDTADVSSAQVVEEVVYPERETDTEIQEVVFEEHEVPEDPEDPETEEEKVHPTLEREMTEDKNSEAEEEMFMEEDTSDNSLQSNAEVEEEQFLDEVQPGVPEAKDIREHDNYLDSCVETESIKAEDTLTLDSSESTFVTHVISPSLEAQDFSVHRSEAEAKLSVPIILGISFLALSLAAAAIYVYAMQRKSVIPNAATPSKELPVMKVVSNEGWAHQARSPSLNWQTEVDLGSESCPSEMSSFQKCSSYNSKRSGNHEAQSLEKKIRKNSKRESSASSSSEFSMDSLSYGSFTTYEIIHKKHGDEEIATPVRRSSRIRSQVISP